MATRSPKSDAELEEGVGGLLHLAVEVGVGQAARVAGLPDPVVGHLVAEAGLDVSVEAVLRDVELAVLEPAGEGQIQARVFVKGRCQRSFWRARSAQKASKSASALAYRSGPALALAVKAGSGGNVRPSAMRFSISWSRLGAARRSACSVPRGDVRARGAQAPAPRPSARRLDPRRIRRASRAAQAGGSSSDGRGRGR